MKFEKIYIELSDICGLKCDFCPSKKSQRGLMDIEKFKSLCNDIYSLAHIFTFHVLGDPLMVKNLKNYLDIANDYGMKIELTTSGFYFNDENISWILESKNIRQVNISLASFLSQSRISLEEYFKNIQKLLILHMQKRAKFFINLRLWNLNKDLVPPPQNDLFYELLKNFFNTTFSKNEEKIRLARYIILHQARLFKWPSLKDEIKSITGKCYALNKQIAILSDGSLVPCCLDTKADIKLGNCFKTNINTLLQSREYIDLKEGFNQGILKAELCKRCDFNKLSKLNHL